MSVVFDEYGRPFIVIREQDRRERLKGLDAQKANILAARTVSNILKTSLGKFNYVFITVFQDQKAWIKCLFHLMETLLLLMMEQQFWIGWIFNIKY